MTSPTSPTEQALEAYYENNIAQGNNLLNSLQAAAQKLAQEEQAYKHCKNPEDRKQLKDEIAQTKANISSLEKQLVAFDAASGPFVSSIQDLIDAMNKVMQHAKGQIAQAQLEKLTSALQQVFSSLKDQLQADAAESLLNSPDASELSPQELEAITNQLLASLQEENATLESLLSSLSDAIVGYHSVYDKAKAERSRYTGVGAFTHATTSHAEEKKYRHRMDFALTMIQKLQAVISLLAPINGSLQPEFVSLQTTLNSIVAKINEILANEKAGQKEKQDAILSLMVYFLGVLALVQKNAQARAAKDQAQTAHANLDAAQMRIADSEMNQKLQEIAIEKSQVLKIIVFVATIIVGAVMTFFAPGSGAALITATMTALSASGGVNGKSVLAKLTDAIAKSTGKGGAEALVAVLEVATTVVGGAGLDMALSSLGKAIVDQAVDAAVTESFVVAQNTSRSIATGIADQTLQGVAQKTAQSIIVTAQTTAITAAAKETYAIFLRQVIAQQLQMAVKGTLRTSLEVALKTATEQAAKAATVAVEDLANTTATSVAALLQTPGNEGAAIALQTAAETTAKTTAISQAAKVVAETLAKKGTAEAVATSMTQSSVSIAARRGAYAALFGIFSTGLPQTAAVAIAEKAGESKTSSTVVGIETGFSVVDSLAAMGAQTFAQKNVAELLSSLSSNLFLVKSLAGQALPTLAQAGSNVGLGELDLTQADTKAQGELIQALQHTLNASFQQGEDTASTLEDRFSQAAEEKLEAQATMPELLQLWIRRQPV